MKIDKAHKLEVTSRLNPNQARKWLSEVLSFGGIRVTKLSRHCREEMSKDSLIPIDVYNVLKFGQIYRYPEFENGSYRYRVETQEIVVVIVFQEPHWVHCITTWRKP